MPLLGQLRNNLLLDTQDEYNCSLADPNGFIDWSTRGTARPVFGSLCIVVSCLGIIAYLICVPVIWELRRHSCYKMMFYLSIVDIGALLGNIYIGAAFIWGEMYCHHPKLNFVLDAFPCGFFYASCGACLMIAVNRLIELLHIEPLLGIYKSKRPWYMMAIPTAYGILAVVCTPPTLLNSEAHVLSADPGFNNGIEYTSYFLIVNNVCVPLLSTLIYAIMIVSVIAKRKKNEFEQAQDAVYRAALMLSAQCGIIVVVHMTTCVGYAVLQFVEASDGLRFALHIGWILIHGTPPYVYLIFNRSIRRGLLRMTVPAQTISNWKPPASPVNPGVR